MLKANKTKRMELYKESSIQSFLGKFLSGKMSELVPVYDLTNGYEYPLVEAIVGDLSAEDFLNKLFEVGMLKRRLLDKIVCCPQCGSANIAIRYRCPYCRSFNIEKSSLVEHVKCGYMDVEENFRKGRMFFCPKCRESFKKLGVDYRRAGIWCTCHECSKNFDIPSTSHFCRGCQGNSAFEDALIKNVYAYSLRKTVTDEIRVGWAAAAPIIGFLEDNGFKVESPAFLKGKSGASHMFDIAAFEGVRPRRVTVIDLASSEDVLSEQPVIALFAKMFDVSPETAYLIAIPKMSENGKKMAELYDIRLVEVREPKDAAQALSNVFLKRSLK